MNFTTRAFVRAQNWHAGQTMTEYALILAAVAVVVYAGYKTMGTSITSLLSSRRRLTSKRGADRLARGTPTRGERRRRR